MQTQKFRHEIPYKPIPLILIHTPFGLKFFDKVAKTKAAKIFSEINTYLMPFITVLAVFLILSSVIIMFSSPEARDSTRDLGPRSILIFPGLNDKIPIVEGWIALIVTIVIHEAGHGIVARVYNIKVESTGLVLFLCFPIGAFVNIERTELDKTSLKQKSAILTAGPLTNMIMAGISLVFLYFVISTLTVVPSALTTESGIQVLSVTSGSLAESIGITKDSILRSVNSIELKNIQDLKTISTDNLGKVITISWTDKNGNDFSKELQLPETYPQNKGLLGVSIAGLLNPVDVLENYKGHFTTQPILLLAPPTIVDRAVPFSSSMSDKYTSSVFGSSYVEISNFLFWMWFINFNVGIFNAIPLGPLDGGQLYGSLIEKKLGNRVKSVNPKTLLDIIMLTIIVLSFTIPWLPFPK